MNDRDTIQAAVSWLRASLDCATHEWDGEQRDAAEETVHALEALLTEPTLEEVLAELANEIGSASVGFYRQDGVWICQVPDFTLSKMDGKRWDDEWLEVSGATRIEAARECLRRVKG